MTDWVTEQAEMIGRNYPNWDVWTVRVLYPKGHYVWCARPKGHPVATINAYSPEELVAAIAEQEAKL